MRNNRVLEELRVIINENFRTNELLVQPDTLLFNGGLNLSSIQLLELIIYIENYYRTEFDPDLLTEDNFKNISSLIDVIVNNLIKE